MDNFGWEISSSMMPPNIWVNQYENNICGTEANYETFQNSSVEMQVGNNSSIGIGVNEMLGRMAVPANFNSLANNVDLDTFLFTCHQPEITNSLDPLPENLIHSSQELQILNPRVNYDYMISSCNFSSGESEAASQGSSQTNSSKQNKNSKRKLEDMQSYYSQCASIAEKGFQIHFDRPKNTKRPKFMKEISGANIDFRQEKNKESYEADTEAIAEVKEMMYKAAAMRPINLVLAETAVDRPKRKNVKISSDPQTVAARQRRERISERLRVLQKLVPGGSKMDTASMLHEAANYLKFLKSQVSALETLGTNSNSSSNDFQAPNFLMFCKMDNPL